MIEYLMMTIKLPGKIDLEEHVEKKNESNVELIEKEVDSIELSIRWDEVGDKIISLSVHHAESESGKKYHADIDGHLTWKMVKELRDFLDLFAKFEEDEEDQEC